MQSAEEALNQQTLNQLNPLVNFSQDPSLNQGILTPGILISRVLLYVFPIASLILFIMLIWSGFQILAGASDKKSLDLGRQRATAALVGFTLLFVSYFIIQLLEVMLGITIIG